MTVAIKALASGQLATTKTTLYTAPAATQAVANDIVLTNTSGSLVKSNMYFKASSGTSKRFTPYDLEIQPHHSWKYPGNITLEAADLIEGDANSGSVIDYIIGGVENA